MSPAVLNQFKDMTDKAIQVIVKKEAKNPVDYKKYYNFRTTTDLFEKDSSISGLKEAEFTSENASILEDVAIQGFDQTYEQQQVDIMFPMSHMTWKFGFKKRQLTAIGEQLIRALNRKKEKLAAERLTNGFSPSYTHQGVGGNSTIALTGGDALEPWTTAHTREDGGTNMNNVVYDGTTYSLPFDYAGYKAADRTASLMVDPRGNPDSAKLNMLVCKKGSSVHHKAMEILGSIKTNKISESNDNDGNAMGPFQIVDLEYLTKDAAWGMFDSSKAMSDTMGFQHIESESNNVDPVNIVTKTREMQFSAHTIFIQGFNDVTRSWVWSEGDEATT